MAKRYVGVVEAAEYIGQKERFIRRLIAERRIRFYKIGKFVSFELADLDAFVKAGQVEPVIAVMRLWVVGGSVRCESFRLNAGRRPI